MKRTRTIIFRQFLVINMEVSIALTGVIFIYLIYESRVTGIDPDLENNTNNYLNTMQIIRKYGYPAEAHTVETADGFLLTMHRIPSGKYSNRKKRDTSESNSRPIFMHHGLLGSSMDYLLTGSKDSLPFLLADLGFDIWLGNARGNSYSRAHVTLFPNEKKFWNFTWHESAVYDVPAQIDFICNHTKQEKVIYIGFSMGTTIFFAMVSTLPEYNDKIELSLLMAAVGYVKNIKSLFIRILTPFSENFKVIAEFIENGEFLPDNKFLKTVSKIFCTLTNLERSLCMNAIFMIVGSDPKTFNKKVLPVLLSYYPAGYSAKAVNHYSQLVKSGRFRQYDYGKKGNVLEYGFPEPPDYNVSLIKTPMYFYEGKNDYLSTLRDVKRLAKQLPTLENIYVVDYPNFSHLDFLVSTDVKKLLYDKLIEDLTSVLNKNNEIYK